MRDGEPLMGGNMGDVRRMGDLVERPAGEWTPAVHRLLRHLSARGIADIPLPVATDGERETVTFVDGEVPAYPMPRWIWTEEALESSATLLRRLHDATVGADQEGPWRSPVREPAEVICHQDFAPYNLVFRDGVAVGVIDWDFAVPGPRVWDLAYLAYRIVPLTTEDMGDGLDSAARSRRLAALLHAYGTDVAAAEVLAVVVERLEALAEFSDRMAAELERAELADHAALYRRDATVLRMSLDAS
ncbi:phosphotransferase enzyme family protein [Demequina sp. NBRC 110055]|uniref:phosphotransferase enzyme family protein n=1 Tax=Demequina sp. NBRC 110055 TaxID=1570344 RepID=UPI001F306D1C|nr:phosphotransferase [Demequina sp. NBRC 110055]